MMGYVIMHSDCRAMTLTFFYMKPLFSSAELRNMLKTPSTAFAGFDKGQIEVTTRRRKINPSNICTPSNIWKKENSSNCLECPKQNGINCQNGNRLPSKARQNYFNFSLVCN